MLKVKSNNFNVRADVQTKQTEVSKLSIYYKAFFEIYK